MPLSPPWVPIEPRWEYKEVVRDSGAEGLSTEADLNLLERVDYQDAFVVDTAVKRAPEQWMRWFLEGAPAWFSAAWPRVFKTLGAQFAPRGTADQVLGDNALEDGWMNTASQMPLAS